MTDLADFLRQRLDEDEFWARGRIANRTRKFNCERVRREVAAGRALLAAHAEALRIARTYKPGDGLLALGQAQALSQAVGIRAAVWSDHPDYRQEWDL